jgi:hypothetical protein
MRRGLAIVIDEAVGLDGLSSVDVVTFGEADVVARIEELNE